MATRAVPRSLDEKVASIEEYLRRVQSEASVAPIDTRFLYDAKGDILIARAAATPLPLHAPGNPPGPGMFVLRANPGTPLGVDWAFVNGLASGGSFSGGGGGAAVPPFATPVISLGSSPSAGIANSVIRADATIEAFDGTSPAAEAFGNAAVVGVVAKAARRDHRHAMPVDPVPPHVALADPHPGYVLESLLDAKGDLYVATADNVPSRLAVGIDGQVLTADAASGPGVKWAAPASSGHTIKENGTPLTARAGLNFQTGLIASDDAGNNETDVDLDYGTPAIVLGTAAAAGVSNQIIRADGTIVAFDVTVPATQAFGDSAATGSAAVAARRDHKHGMPANPTPGFATPSIVLGSAAAAGSASTVIRSDATIVAFDTTVPGTSAIGDAAAVGTAAVAARRDHQHGRESFATPAIVLGTAAAAGVATTPIRSDATIVAFDATNPTTEAFGDSPVVGVAAVAARRDHKHGMPANPSATFGLPAIVFGTAAAAGVINEVIRRDATIVAFDATVPTTSAVGDAAAVGAAAVAARRDHVHGREAFATPAVVLGTVAAAGSASTLLRSDGTIVAFDTTAPVTQAFGDVAATGAVALAARRDHKHGMPATPFYQTVQDEGVDLTQRAKVNYVGAGVTAADSGGVTTVTIPGGGGSATFAGSAKFGGF